MESLRSAASIDWLGLLNHLNHQTAVAHPSLLVCAPAHTCSLSDLVHKSVVIGL
jgi:hypothetical protein